MARCGLPVIAVLLCVLFGVGCGSAPATLGGTGGVFGLDTLEFELLVLPGWVHHTPGATLMVSLPRPLLTFQRTPAGFVSHVETTVRVLEDSSGALALEEIWRDTVVAYSYEETRGIAPVVIQRVLHLEPGQFRVTVVLEDLHDGRRSSRVVQATVADLESGRPFLGDIWLDGVPPGGVPTPILGYLVPSRFDSLTAQIQSYNLPRNRQVRLDIRLISSFPDTGSAVSPMVYSLRPTAVGPDLYEESRLDTLEWHSGPVVDEKGSVHVHYRVPHLSPGMYFVEFVLQFPDTATPGGVGALRARRAFGIPGHGFPRPVTVDELLPPLAYIADPEEVTGMRSAETPEERRRLFESFWRGTKSDAAAATDLIRLYYSRVEEANRLFSTHKPGWQTDRGMVYIVLGPPESIVRRIDAESWQYSAGGRQAGIFQFRRVANTGPVFSFVNYVLLRSAQFTLFWSRMVKRWRSGEVR